MSGERVAALVVPKVCIHCDRPCDVELAGLCSDSCRFCCGSRCVHVRALISDLRREIADLRAKLPPPAATKGES